MRKSFLRPTLIAAAGLLGPLTLSSCASALKQKCEATNWFEHGELVAKRGQRTSTDGFLGQCEKEEAKIDHAALSQGFQKGLGEYCTPEFAHRLGKQGDFLSEDMCAGAMELRMRPEHAAGVREYCQAANGETAGSSGRKYNQICPKELETAFLPEFKKGRRKYLAALVAQKQAEIQDIDQDVLALERRRLTLRDDLQRMEWDKRNLQSRIPPGATELDASVKAARNDLYSLDSDIRSKRRDADGLDAKINESQNRQRTLRQEIREAQTELSVL